MVYIVFGDLIWCCGFWSLLVVVLVGFFVLVCDLGWFCFVNCLLFGLRLDVLFVHGLVVCLLNFGCLLVLISFD